MPTIIYYQNTENFILLNDASSFGGRRFAANDLLLRLLGMNFDLEVHISVGASDAPRY